MVFGLDMRFLGRKWQKENNGKGNGNGMSCFAFDFGPAFGEAVGPRRGRAQL
jgi:hypothetical protein